jgi:hypothetical protein
MSVSAPISEHRDHGFVMGLFAGTFVGAGLMMWLAPAVDRLSRKAQGVRDDVADAVARGAHEVERVATAAKSDRAEVRNHSSADRSTRSL